MGDSHDLIELPKDKLMVGMALKYTLRDQGGTVLLAKGQKIENAATLTAIKARGRLYVEIEESDEGIRLMMAGLTEMSRKDAPIKDFSKFFRFFSDGAMSNPNCAAYLPAARIPLILKPRCSRCTTTSSCCWPKTAPGRSSCCSTDLSPIMVVTVPCIPCFAAC